MDPTQKPAFIHTILLNRPFRVLLALFVGAVLLPVLAYMIWFSREIGANGVSPIGGTAATSCGHPEHYRIQCGRKDISIEDCHLSGCCFINEFGCFHKLPSLHQFVKSSHILRPTQSLTPFGNPSVSSLEYCINTLARNRLAIVLQQTNHTKSCDSHNPETVDMTYRVRVDPVQFIVSVYDKANDRLLLSTSKGPLIASPEYFEWSLYFGESLTIIGFGDYAIRAFPYRKLVMLDGDVDAVPVAWIIDKATKSLIIVQLKSNAPIEVEISEAKVFSIRAMSSDWFELDVTFEAKLSDAFQLLSKPNVDINYWRLGVNVFSKLNATQSLTTNLTTLNVPYDAITIIDDSFWLFERNDSAIISELRRNAELDKKRINVAVHSQILVNSEAYASAREGRILLRQADHNEPYHGLIANQTVAYIDWTAERSLLLQFMRNHLMLQAGVDGVWLKPNFLTDENHHLTPRPVQHQYPYVPENLLDQLDSLVPQTLRHSSTSEIFDILKAQNTIPHRIVDLLIASFNRSITTSSYSNAFPASIDVFRNKRQPSWSDLQEVMRQMLADSLIGNTISGSNVCGRRSGEGLIGDDELCVRWYQLASVGLRFHVSSHSTPDKFVGFTQRCLVAILQRRYALLPYIYTTLLHSGALLTPSFADLQTINSEEQIHQFLLGQALLIVPILQPTIREIKLQTTSDCFELWGGKHFTKGEHSISVGLKHLPMFLLSGHIVPVHRVSEINLDTAGARHHPIALHIGLSCENGACIAQGQYSISAKARWTFSADRNQVNLTFHGNRNPDWCVEDFEGNTISILRIYRSNASTKVVDVNADLCAMLDSNEDFISIKFD